MKKFLTKQHLLLSGLGFVALAPIAVAASCGSDDDKPVNTSAITKYTFNATSTHDAVTWPALASEPTISKVAFYYSDAVVATSALEKLPEASWKAVAPAAISFNSATRYLYARITPASGYAISNQYLDLTTTSKINTVKSKVDALPTFETFSLSAIEIYLPPVGAYTVTEVTNLPQGTKIVYDIESRTNISLAELQTALEARPAETILSTIKARLQSTDSTKFTLVNNKETTPTMRTPGQVSTTALTNLTVNATSTHDAVVWGALTTDASISKVEFYYSVDTTTNEELAALPATSWQTTLPVAVNYDAAKRHVYAKITPAENYAIASLYPYLDLTSTSQIGTVKSKIDALPGFATFSLSTVEIYLNPSGPYEVTEVTALPQNTKIVYDIETSIGISRTELLTALAPKPAMSVLETIKVYLASTDSTKFVLIDNKQVSPVLKSSITVDELSATEITELNKVVARSASLHNAVTWDTFTTISTRVDSLIYLSGDYATEEAALAAPSNSWTTTLPTSVDYDHAKRHLWAKVQGASGYVFTKKYYDITISSGIKTIKSLVDALAGYTTTNLAVDYSLGGDTLNPAPQYTGPDTVKNGTGYRLIFDFLTLQNLSFADFSQAIKDNAATMTPTDLATIRVAFEASDSAKFVVNDPKKSAIKYDAFRIIKDPKAVVESYRAGGTAASLTWNTVTVPTGVTFEYISGNYTTEQQASVAPAAIGLPASVAATAAERHLWIKVTADAGYKLLNDISFFDITTTSGIQTLS